LNQRRWIRIKQKIDWTKFKDKYVRLITGVEKKLALTDWHDGIWFDKPGIRFRVVKEDGVHVQKQYTVTSRRLIRALKPIIMKAEEGKRDTISVSILKIGEGFDTRYTIKELK